MHTLKTFFVTSLLALVGVSANAALVFKDGDDVRFWYDDSTLYGDAMVVGNSIFFLPTNFRAESLNGAGAVSTSETLNIEIEVLTENFLITDFQLAEQGDYFLDGVDAEVTANGRLEVFSLTKSCGIFPCNDSEVFNIGGLTTQGAVTNWSGGTSIDLANTVGWDSDTNVNAQIQNNLTATTLNNGETAWIQKKAQLVGLEVTVVPIPAAVWLFMSALGLVGAMRMRRS